MKLNKKTFSILCLSSTILFSSVLGFNLEPFSVNETVSAESKESKESKVKELKSSYDDLYDGDWELEYTDWGIEQGVISLFNDNTVRVNEELSESELMDMVGNYLGLKSEKVGSLYNDLRDLGIVVNGTMNVNYRSEVITLEDGVFVAMSLFDNDKFKNRKSKINEALLLINKNDSAKELKMSDELTKIDMLRILKSYSDSGRELIVSNPIFKIGDNWKVSYVSDSINKHISYLEVDSGLLINVIELSSYASDDESLVNLVKEGTGKNLSEYKNAKYFISLNGVGNSSLELNGFSIVINDSGNARDYFKTTSNVVLGGNSSVLKVIEGTNISDLKVVVGEKILNIDLKSLSNLKNNEMYIEDSSKDKLNMVPFYLNNNIKDIHYQLEEHFYEEYISSKE